MEYMTVDIATLAIRIDSLEARNAARDLDRMRDSGNRAERSTNTLTSATRGLSSAMAVMGVTLGAASLMKLTTELYAAAAAAENLRMKFKFSFGEGAGKELNYVKGLTNELGLELSSTANAYGKLSAAARGTSMEGAGARAIFESISKASAVMGLSAEESAGALNAVQQMISKGTVASEELRGQLGERLPGAFQIASRAMGVTTQELGKMLEQGQVIADDFLPKFAAQLKSEIGDASSEAADRLDASTNRMWNSLKRLTTNVAESGIAAFFKDVIKAGTNDFNAIAEAMERAKNRGAGGIGQLNAGAGMLIGKSLGLNFFTDEAKTLDQQLASTIKRISELQKKIDETGGGNIYARSDMGALQKTLASLTAEQQNRDRVNAVNPQDARLAAMGEARAAQIKKEAQATADLAGIRLKLSGVDANYLPTLAKLQAMREAGTVSEKEYVSIVSDLAGKNFKKSESSKASSSAAAKEATAYQSLISSIREKLAASKLELIGYDKLSDSQKLTIRMDEEIKSGKIKNKDGSIARAQALIAEVAANEKLAASNKLIIEQAEEMAKIQAEYADRIGKSVDDANKEAAAAEDLVRTFGMTKTAIGEMTLARMNEDLVKKRAIDGADDNVAALEREIAAMERRVAAGQQLEGLEASKKANDDAVAAAKKAQNDMAADWQKSVEQYDDVFRKGFASMVNGGKGTWKAFTTSLVTTFRTSVADQIYKMFAQPFVVKMVASLIGAVGGGAVSGAAQAAVGGGGSAGSSAISGLSTIGSLSSGVGILGAAGLGMQAGFGALMSGGLAGVGAAVSGGAAAMAAGTGASIAAGMGAVVGALGPIGLAIAAVYMLVKGMDDSGTYHTGAGASASSAGGVTAIRPESIGFQGTRIADNTQQMVSGVAASVVKILDSTALTFGKAAGYTAATAFADDTSKDGAWGSLLITKLGETLINWEDGRKSKWAPKEFADGAEGQKQYVAALSASVRSALDSIGLPTWAQSMLDSLGSAPALEDLAKTVDAINATQTALLIMGDRLTGFAGMTGEAASALMSASGGIESLVGNASAYYDNFYSDAEKTAVVTRQVTDALSAVNLAMPTTREAYRAQVEAQMALGEAGAPAVAVLLRANGAFASLVPAVDQVVTVVRTATDILSERSGLQDQLDSLTMTSAQLLAKQRDALDDSNEGLFDNIQALTAAREASKTALSDLITSTQSSIDGMVSLYGDLAGAIAEMNPPVKTLVDQWRASSSELTTLTQGLAAAMGELPEASALDRLKSTLSALSSATAGIGNISEQIFNLQTGRGDQAAVDLLRGRESALFAEMASSMDPGAISAKLSQTMLSRIALQAKLSDAAANASFKSQFDAATTLAQLDKDNRSAQIKAVQDQISGAERLIDVVGGLKRYVSELKFGSLSALNPTDQLGAARGLFDSTLAGSRAGDATAMSALQGSASSYLQSAQGYYGGATSQYAGVFQTVTSALEQFGAAPVTDVSLLQSQLDVLQSMSDSSIDLQTTLTDTTDLQISALNSINTALTTRQDDLKQAAQDQQKAVQDQIVELKALVAGQAAQIRQQAAIFDGLMKKLDDTNKSLESLDKTGKEIVSAPA